MEAITNFFQWIADMAQIFFDLIGNFFSSIINFFKIIPTVLFFVRSSIAYLPDSVMVFGFVAITVAIVLLVLGRSNN